MATGSDIRHMKRALALARRGIGRVSPNPMVGAVIVKKGRVIAEGYHRTFGGRHAEIEAIEKTDASPRGADIYVTLEPCSHFGKTPPCTDRLIEIQPARVIIGTRDPNPLVAGKGIAALEAAGIPTVTGVLEKECRRLNEVFFTFMERGTPFVTLKYAQTLDGRIAAISGDSRWISSPESRRFAHRLRSRHDVILVGAGTVLADDPELTVRLVRGRTPLRVVVDSMLTIPLESRILKDQDTARTIVLTSSRRDLRKQELFRGAGIETIVIEEEKEGLLDMKEAFRELGKRGLSSVLVEGGAGIITSCLRQGCADRVVVITAPRILGRGIDAVGDLGKTAVDQSVGLKIERIMRRDSDIIIDARPKY
ncbi:MAG: bifunctional diaminohydroxyphosphoribosylaminopyrimidine deaminase/5-amino-6-(5-phosphoribosylamino)uracil reductase RibD [Syntrophales bacterium]|jgi:diaminohydroxyphosphoribosylaminopyrimidine deaminase/5-amino-6-(5-phosphoribosylamino)uracil reductase|nr:bifunctional diaminohydroxyphosphoribosylaminopyrimidine deaminase/5-amino-6-(5-phosphoribosylamino)uracil reductase RibD [Syntrophales bacterium]MCK9527539.1 bifunctional diaminohydroxyphosphoribosylaminopyrimidine deaminase/5-amino-6-(5-phosphoribosylamino)uracil reductase RibD [Syntrophales bacterium]MDX9922596.1 bifunctional diaminohydroxyphosphoribosylaminopyrimidine deaminase/5-amino-6-(5-phosphoribosylamino)uracil reductase RibD [Syntrophales bacterium]